jgi:hypothetical protein
MDTVVNAVILVASVVTAIITVKIRI